MCCPDNNPRHRAAAWDAEGGAATGVFAAVVAPAADAESQPAPPALHQNHQQHQPPLAAVGDGGWSVHGAALGDAVAILVDGRRGRARVLNAVHRRCTSALDSGGQAGMCLGVDGTVEVFTAPVTRDDLIILATDGLTDNLLEAELPALLPLIATAHFFDASPAAPCPTTLLAPARLPTVDDVRDAVASAGFDDMLAVAPHTVAQRLVNYVLWVTAVARALERDFYELELRRTALPPDDPGLPAIEEELAALTKRRRRTPGAVVGKTDDVMILAMSPFHRLGTVGSSGGGGGGGYPGNGNADAEAY